MRTPILRKRVVAAVLAVAAAAALVGPLTAAGSAQQPSARTVAFVLHFGGVTNFVDNKPSAHGFNPGPGDILTIRSSVFDAADQTRLGRTSELCIGTVKRPFTMQCSFTLLLKGGTLTVEAAINPTHTPWTAPVTGGTGEFAGARGTLHVAALRGRKERWTFTLLA